MKQQAKSFFRKLHGRVKSALKREPELPVIYNVNSIDDSPDRKRALLVYLVKSFLFEESDPKFLTHQNLKRCKQIAAVLDEFDYVVDAIDRRSFGLLKNRDYDLSIRSCILNRWRDILTQILKEAAAKKDTSITVNQYGR